MSKSGLFAHFRSKEQLQIDLLDEMARVANQHVVAPAMVAPEGLPRLQDPPRSRPWLELVPAGAEHFSGGCPIAAALFELDDLDGEVRAHVVRAGEPVGEGCWPS